ncbi:MAG TPA: CDP-alcohol phosphatidyltransferase family protein, partial [Desulfurococcaceae archaeon]|nr:CDP-alcohol phosphatidyltransferase family protein [Desulfurococcaceae archaeon]
MLSKLRGKVDQYLQDIAKIFIRIGLSANEITFLGFLLAILAPVYA